MKKSEKVCLAFMLALLIASVVLLGLSCIYFGVQPIARTTGTSGIVCLLLLAVPSAIYSNIK